MRRITIALARVVAAVTVGAALAAGAINASAESVSPLLAKEIAVLTDRGIPRARAMQALTVQGKVARAGLARKLQGALGNAYAGVWFDNGAAQLHIGATSYASRRRARAVLAREGLMTDATVVPVRSTMRQLLAAQKRWNAKLSNWLAREDVKTGIEPQRNAVAVTLSSSVPVPKRAALKRQAAAADVNVRVRIAAGPHLGVVSKAKECNKFPPANCDPSITAGVKITNKKWNCTAGPGAIPVNKKRTRVLLTAGHCMEKEKEEWFAFKRNLEEPLIGKSRKFVAGGNPEEKKGDYGEILIEAGGGWQTGNAKTPVLAVTAEWKKMEETRYPVKEEREPTVGNTNCHEGMKSGEQCGKITQLSVTYKSSGTTKEGMVEDREAINETGDSGGPWLFIEPNNEVLMEGTNAAGFISCKKNKVAGEGPEFFETEAECLNEENIQIGKKGVWERTMESFWEPLTQPVPGAGEGSLEALGLELLTKANETLPPRPAFIASKFPVKFTMESGEGKLETLGGRSVKCKASKGEGEVASATEVKNMVVKFTGCKGKISTLEGPCKSSGAAAEEIVTNKIKGGLFYLNKATKEVGLLSEPQEAGGLYAEFKCENVLTETVKVKGTTLGKLTPINTSTTKYTLTAKQEKGKPSPSEYENEKSEKAKSKMEVKGEGFEAFGYEESGLEGTPSLTTAEAIEAEA